MSTRRTASPTRDVARPPDDAELMRGLASGDIGALGTLYDRHHEPIRRFLARATADAEDVDDLVHSTFLAAAKSAGRYDGRCACRPWLIGIAVQLLRRRRRALGRFLAFISALSGTRAASGDPRSELQARSDVERALGKISEAKRITFLMAKVEGLSCEEIAFTLGVPIGTVWTRLHAARRELRESLEEGGES